MGLVDDIASTLVLGAALDALRVRYESFEPLDHWQQGEFHHDVVVRIPDGVLVIATNCNEGVQDVSWFPSVPERKAVWAHRCPRNPAFDVAPAVPLARSTTIHWFGHVSCCDPTRAPSCALNIA